MKLLPCHRCTHLDNSVALWRQNANPQIAHTHDSDPVHVNVTARGVMLCVESSSLKSCKRENRFAVIVQGGGREYWALVGQ
jgi:hypothetical protein